MAQASFTRASEETRIFVGKALDQLSDLIAAQAQDVFETAGLSIPPRSCSLMCAIQTLGSAAAADLATALGCSHQLVLQKIPALLALGLIERTPCPDDARRKLFALTDHGQEEMALFDRLRPALERAYARLAAEHGDLFRHIEEAREDLLRTPLSKRVEL